MMTGAAPRGMWWVARRQHRIQILTALAVMALIAIALLLFRLTFVARLHSAGCLAPTDPVSCTSDAALAVASDYEGWQHLLSGVLVAAPIVLGVFLGAPLFPREFEQRTDVFALTQSVGRRRWWITKVTTVGAPLLVGLLALGFLMQWAESATWFSGGDALYDSRFQVRSIMPAAFGLLAFAIAVTTGLLVRSVTASLVGALIVAGGVVLVVAYPLRPHLLPASRFVEPVSAAQAGPVVGAGVMHASTMPDGLFLRTGTLDAAGRVVQFDISRCSLPSVTMISDQSGSATAEEDGVEAFNRALAKCRRDQGIVADYTDYLPARLLWPLRGVVTAICVALAVLALALGAVRLRAAPRPKG